MSFVKSMQKRKEEAPVYSVPEPSPITIDDIVGGGLIIGFYGSTNTGKSTLLASVPHTNEKEIEKWKDDCPDFYKLVKDGGFPLLKPGSVGVIDTDRKWPAYLGKGDWIRRGYLDLYKQGYYKIYKMPTAPRNDEITSSGRLTPNDLKVLESARIYFTKTIDLLTNDPDIKVIIIDTYSGYLDICTRKFFSVFDRSIHTLTLDHDDKVKSIRQSWFGIRNQWFFDEIEKLRDSGKWVFLTFNVNRIPKQYQKAARENRDSTDIFNTGEFTIEWVNRTPEKIDQVNYTYRIPNASDSSKDEFHVYYKKGPMKPSTVDLRVPDTRYPAQYYMNTIARALAGEEG